VNLRPSQMLLGVITVIVLISAVAAIYLQVRAPNLNLAGECFDPLGTVVAQETEKMLDGQGTIVVVAEAAGKVKSAEDGATLRAFQKTIQQHGRIHVTAVELVAWPADVSVDTAITTNQFDALLRRYPAIDAVVSFVGPPPFDPGDLKARYHPLPRMIVVSGVPYVQHLKSLLFANIVQEAIVPWPGGGTVDNPGQLSAARKQFDAHFKIFTPATGDSLR